MSKQNVNDDISGAERSALDYFSRHSVIERLRKKQQCSPVIEKFDDGAILLIVSSYHSMYIEDVIEKHI